MDDGNISKDLLFKIHSFYKDLDPVIPPFLRVAGAIKAAVMQGLIAPGEPVPSTGSLAQQLGINPMTAVKALQNVALLEIVQRSRGSNYVVCENGRSLCAEMIEGEILEELRYLHRKMKHCLINRTQIIQWLKVYEEVDESLGNAKKRKEDNETCKA